MTLQGEMILQRAVMKIGQSDIETNSRARNGTNMNPFHSEVFSGTQMYLLLNH
jgi:hypothetical protein